MVLCVLLVSGCDPTAPSDSPSSSSTTTEEAKHPDESRFQGLWGTVSWVENGQGWGEIVDARESAIRFLFKADKFMLLPSGLAGDPPQGSFKLGSSGRTKTIDLIYTDSPDAVLGIYEIEADTLKICTGAKRPNEFKSVAGSQRTMFVLKQLKDLSWDGDSRHGKGNLPSRLLLDRWAGQWESTITDKLTDASDRADAAVGISNVAKILDDHVLQSHWTSEDGTEEILSLLAYDDKSAAYRSWTFSSKGAALEFAGQWDDATSTLTLEVVPPVPGVTGTSITRFVDADTIETRLVVKDEAGVVTRHILETLTRKSKTAASDIPPADDNSVLSPEQKVFDHSPGNWRQTGTFFKAEWTPKQTQLTGTASCTRILNGRFIETKLKGPEGTPYHLILMTYDAQRKSYRRWDFDSDGQASEYIGKWDADAKSMTWSQTMGGSLTNTIADRYVDADTSEWSLVIKDRNGKVYLHVEGNSKRVK